MVVFPNSKINLGLHITRKREDGYHDLETIFYPVLHQKDILECIKLPGTAGEDIVFTSSGLSIAGNTGDNLCIKAYRLLKKDFSSLMPVQMHLHKAIPMGAGLGGGSADGAFALRMLNDMLKLGLSQQQLIDYALQLGSDCPFFIVNKPCIATGRGEIMEEIELDLSMYTIKLFNPEIHVSTASAFTGIVPKLPKQPLREIIKRPVTEWKDLLTNDFEATVTRAHPEIAFYKECLYNAGALYASMTGSGSVLYGIFDGSVQPDKVQWGKWYGSNPFLNDNNC